MDEWGRPDIKDLDGDDLQRRIASHVKQTADNTERAARYVGWILALVAVGMLAMAFLVADAFGF